MISVCVTVYKFPVQELIDGLISQAEALNIEYEILIGDDSPQKTQLKPAKNVLYFHNSPALKRSANRNFLASKAKYKYLLFIDGDAKIENGSFLKNYLNEIKTNAKIVCGGTLYSEKCPSKDKKLHWKYGKFVESKPAVLRSKTPYSSFTSFNFLIEKEIFLNIKFNEKLTEYGHEDTIFGFELERQGVEVNHIDNQLIHSGVETNDVFVRKSLKAVENLIFISNNIDSNIRQKVRLFAFYEKIKHNAFLFFVLKFTNLLFYNTVKKMTVNLSNLRLFALLKLLHLHKNVILD